MWVGPASAEYAILYYAHAVTEGGVEQCHQEKICLNQSGRSLAEQTELEFKSRLSRYLDKGYKTSRSEALQGATNQLGLVNPMLAQPFERVQLSEDLVGYVQRKYDGHRCLITKQGGEVIAYTRRGKLIETINPILEDVAEWLPEGYTLDGELYVKGYPLQAISSFIKRAQPMSEQLTYHNYDLVSGEKFTDRWRELQQLHQHTQTPRIKLVPTVHVTSLQSVYELFKTFRSAGYEGAMLRRSLRGYEDSKRSDQLIKVKERADMEVVVLDVIPSKDGWGICVCRTVTGKIFNISAPGTVLEKTSVLQNKELYIGRLLTIEYANLTAEGIPFHAVALRWRDDV